MKLQQKWTIGKQSDAYRHNTKNNLVFPIFHLYCCYKQKENLRESALTSRRGKLEILEKQHITFSRKRASVILKKGFFLYGSSSNKAIFFKYSKLFEFIRILDADYSVFEIPLFVFELPTRAKTNNG